MRTLALLAALLLVGCHSSDEVVCSDWGVKDGESGFILVMESEVSTSEVQDLCQAGPIREGYLLAGCIKQLGGDMVGIVWESGNYCAEMHERSHAKCGLEHTPRYYKELSEGHPRPGCKDGT